MSGEIPSAVMRKAGEERVSAGRSGAMRERPPPAALLGSSQFFFHSWKWKSACCLQPLGISSAASSTGVLLHDPSRALTYTGGRGAMLLALCASDDAHLVRVRVRVRVRVKS